MGGLGGRFGRDSAIFSMSPRADRALGRLMAARGAMLATEVDHLQVQLCPGGLREGALQVGLGVADVVAAGQPPARREPVDVRVYREGGPPERLTHHDAGGLVADA